MSAGQRQDEQQDADDHKEYAYSDKSVARLFGLGNPVLCHSQSMAPLKTLGTDMAPLKTLGTDMASPKSFNVGQRVVVPHLDRGGVVVAVNGQGYDVDFDRGDVETFTAAQLDAHD